MCISFVPSETYLYVFIASLPNFMVIINSNKKGMLREGYGWLLVLFITLYEIWIRTPQKKDVSHIQITWDIIMSHDLL